MNGYFYSSPQLPRLLDADAIKRTICDGVAKGEIGYASKDADGRLKLERFEESLSEQEVEVSDEMFILKAEDAQKLQEPPRLARLTLRPDHVTLGEAEQASFTCVALDQYDQPFDPPAVTWSATGGDVTDAGLFTAGTTGGLHTVKAEANGLEAIAEVRVRSAAEQESDGDDIDGGRSDGQRLVQWSGAVPPQKWMNFYTKVLSRFATRPDLKLNVSFQVSVDDTEAQAKTDEVEAAIKELGLDDR